MSISFRKSTVVFVAVVYTLAIVDRARGFSIVDCSGGASDAKLTSVAVSSCPDASGSVCPLVRGDNATIESAFEVVNTFDKATVEVYGKLGPVSIPFAITPNEACGNYGFDCPLKAGDKRVLKMSLTILKSYPKLSVGVTLKLVDENKKPIICFQFPAKIVDKI